MLFFQLHCIQNKSLFFALFYLYQSKKFKAKVRADGSIVSSNNKGSIHQIGAEVQDASACNGWTFWHFDVEGELKPIDLLRQKLRSELN